MAAEPDVDGFAALGVAVAPAPPSDETEDYPVWSINWPALIAFLDCATQWRSQVAPSGRLIWFGLDYTAVDVVLRRRKADDDVFPDLCAMELAALPILNEAVA